MALTAARSATVTGLSATARSPSIFDSTSIGIRQYGMMTFRAASASSPANSLSSATIAGGGAAAAIFCCRAALRLAMVESCVWVAAASPRGSNRLRWPCRPSERPSVRCPGERS